MLKPRFQVFLSSTFRDLKAERQAVLDAVLSVGHFPSGMELFPASDATPWDVIARVIDDSDYYILLVGGLYGSTDNGGISYTEREYDYAVSKKLPVLAFLHQSPADIPAGKSEITEVSRSKLDAFRTKVQRKHCKYWASAQDLQYKVAVALIQEINTNPRTGWVRSDSLQVVADARLQEQLRKATEELAVQQQLREAAESRVSELEHELSAARAALLPTRTPSNRSSQSHIDLSPDAIKIPLDSRSLNPNMAREILAGKLVALDSFVIWDATPQGVTFWAQEHKYTQKSGKISDAAKAAIHSLLQSFEENSPEGKGRSDA